MNRGTIVTDPVRRKAVWGGIFRGRVGLVMLLGLAMFGASCGDAVRQGTGSSYLIVNSLMGRSGDDGTFGATLQSDVLTDEGSVFSDSGQVTLTLAMKDNLTSPTTNNFITVERYRVRFTRSDGRNTPGVDVPYGFDGAVTATVSAQSIVQFELIRHVAKLEAPLSALASNPVIISTIAEITFYGRDQTGHEVSASGQMLVSFGNFAG